MKNYRRAGKYDITCDICLFMKKFPGRRGIHCSISPGGSNRRVSKNKTCDHARVKTRRNRNAKV